MFCHFRLLLLLLLLECIFREKIEKWKILFYDYQPNLTHTFYALCTIIIFFLFSVTTARVFFHTIDKHISVYDLHCTHWRVRQETTYCWAKEIPACRRFKVFLLRMQKVQKNWIHVCSLFFRLPVLRAISRHWDLVPVGGETTHEPEQEKTQHGLPPSGDDTAGAAEA